MSGCCGPVPEKPSDKPAESTDPERYRSIFGPSFSRSVTRRYEKNGLRPVERRMVDFLAGVGLDGASVLEVGGGAGEIQLELLARGAAQTENLELSDSYEADAARLIGRAGMTGRVRRRLGVDLAQTPDAVEPADVVVLHRVVCCYPDYEKLLGAAAEHARRAIVFSYPPANAFNRIGTVAINAIMRLTRHSYRAFAHEPQAMIDVVRSRGLEPVYATRGLVWQISGAVRRA